MNPFEQSIAAGVASDRRGRIVRLAEQLFIASTAAAYSTTRGISAAPAAYTAETAFRDAEAFVSFADRYSKP
jgi:hypothetical protein